MDRISFYGYLFEKKPDQILRYDILFKNEDKFLLKITRLDNSYENPTGEITIRLYHTLLRCMSAVVVKLRNREVRNGVYKELTPVGRLPKTYLPLIREMAKACQEDGIRTFSFFGHLCKYKPRTAAREVLLSMGYFVPTTRKPHVYVLDECVRKELLSRTGR